MCGLTFLYGMDDPEPRTAAALQLMRHRGPDESDSVAASGAQLGHVRLSIIDLQGSHQPLFSPDGRFALVYNGEIYNYRELRKRLETRWSFRTGGDTEVLLAGLVTEGETFLAEADGMWAFALWDTRERSLLLGRDRFGKKPLYFFEGGGGTQLAVASELPVLRRLADCGQEEDADSVADFFRYGFFLPGTTIYRDIREVMPGCIGRWSPGMPVRSTRWWQTPAPGEFGGTPDDAAHEVSAAFDRSVRNRLVADVEVGAFLSGGIDSSLVAARASRLGNGRLRTFSIGFAAADYDETRYARQVAELIGSNHQEEQVAELEKHKLEEILTGSVGQPFGDPSLLPTELVSELAARDVKVALSGDGADELFSGYQRYQAQVLLRWYSRLPSSLRRFASRTLTALPAGRMHHSRSLLKKAQMFTTLAENAPHEPYVAPRFFDEDFLARLLPGFGSRGHHSGLPEKTGLNDLEQMMQHDALVYLPQDILLKVDRASMRHSLEVRAPFLGRDVAELALSLPGSWHRHMISGKRILRDSFGGEIPKTVWRRRKQGFAVPVSHWFAGQAGDQLLEMLGADPGPLDGRVVRSLLDDHRSSRGDHGLRLWIVYSYLLWRNCVWR